MGILENVNEYILNIPIVGKIVTLIVIIFAVNELIDKYTMKKVNVLKSILGIIPKRIQKNKANTIKKYYATLESKEFIDWQNIVLKKIYNEYPFTKAFETEYPVVCFKSANKASYPFDDIYDQNELVTYVEDYKINSSIQKEYKYLVGDNIMRPTLKGFMLDRIELDNNGDMLRFKAKTGTYEQNVYSSHILEYELFQTYNKGLNNINQMSADTLIGHMQLRKAIHHNLSQKDVLTTGTTRSSLLGVQIFVVFRNHEDNQYKVLVIKRSVKVASKPGYYQFIPSGGFEIFENSDDDEILRNNFSVRKVLFRELIEEAFGEEEYEHNEKGVPVENILNHKSIKSLIKMINKEGDEKGVFFEFLGTVVDLVGLRNELSFILRIDDTSFSENTFKPNHESKDVQIIGLDRLSKFIKSDKLNQGSAGLFHLVSDHYLYKEITD
ncbi:hypothetical protein [Paenibacillus agricola]|uniref:Nudix hydrolase domain-containing protein n=1 Tax=Paenibacillus agricola TaxID=2716264 RepID=A0ABX0J759_9BACL|nr:hypothetical protein [Paenibacillus agricola]NHN29625.1 hypothetical protein [Paenibacillus agricola]